MAILDKERKLWRDATSNKMADDPRLHHPCIS